MSNEEKLSLDDQIIKAKELFTKGSRNYFLKCYAESADDLSEVCALYEEIYGELSNELGMPYLLYAKSLIALAYEENKVVDISEEEENGDVESEEEENGDVQPSDISGVTSKINEKNPTITINNKTSEIEEKKETSVSLNKVDSSTETSSGSKSIENETMENSTKADDEDEASSNLQLAWEILELAAKIFTRQGLSGLHNLAEVHTELGNIEFENNIPDSAREDYEKALKIYNELNSPARRTMAEIHYKIGLTYLMQQMNTEGVKSLQSAYDLIEDELNELKGKQNQSENNADLVKDLEETKNEIGLKISEVEEIRQQIIADAHAAVENYESLKQKALNETQPSSSGTRLSSTQLNSTPTDITHLIKRKKPDIPPNSEELETTLLAKRKAL